MNRATGVMPRFWQSWAGKTPCAKCAVSSNLVAVVSCEACAKWQNRQGKNAHCFDHAVANVVQWKEGKRIEALPKKRESTVKPINHQPVKRAVKPRKNG